MAGRRRSSRAPESDRVGLLAAVFDTDPLTGSTAELRRVQPYAARKSYVCPGCNQDIPPGTGHLVVVPLEATDSRRHWHHPCWQHRARRRPGR